MGKGRGASGRKSRKGIMLEASRIKRIRERKKRSTTGGGSSRTEKTLIGGWTEGSLGKSRENQKRDIEGGGWRFIEKGVGENLFLGK